MNDTIKKSPEELRAQFRLIQGGKTEDITADTPEPQSFFMSGDMDEATRREVEYMLFTDPADDTFDFSKFDPS